MTNVSTDSAPVGGSSELVDRLAAHRTVGKAPEAELRWLATRGRLMHYAPGVVLSTTTIPIAGMFVVLSGRIALYVTRGGARHKFAEWHAGDVTGVLPYSRVVAAPGDTIVEDPTDLVLLARDELPAMARECHELTSLLVHVMVDRARFFTSSLLHDEKLKSLGRLAAGLAHELNNPASAITRFAKTLPAGLDAAETASQALAAADLDPEELAVVRGMSANCQAATERQVRSPLQEAEREDQIADWLVGHGIDASDAEAIAQSNLTIEGLERLAAAVRRGSLGPALRWLAADCTVRDLARQIDHAGTRISDLVTAVRSFTRVDASNVPQPVDIGEGLGQTLAVLKGKARDKAVALTVTVDDGLPPARGLAAELNQVWINLIDNALDAVPRGGHVTVSATRRDASIVVRVLDDGPGIAPEIRERIFDPFFTTKDVGKGTGLGLDIVHRLVERHDGDIEVASEPGRTEFTVTLPLAARAVPEPQP